jgi:predicted amidohydrolase YtcJ
MLNRRKFMLLATTATVLGSRPVKAQDRPVADRIWSGGPILTMNDEALRAEAVAEKDGRILAVGTVDDVMRHKGPQTRVIDLGGRSMLPGFVDAHGHMFIGGLQALSANLLAPPDGTVTDIASLQQVIRDWVAANKRAVEEFGLIMGFGYDNATLAEHRHPTREDLDVISTDLPIYLVHQSGHMGAANSKAIELIGYTRDTKDPPGGVIRRDSKGEPNGVFEELAHGPALMKMLGRLGPSGAKALARAGSELWARFGYTTAEEGHAIPPVVEILRQVADEGGYKIDVTAYSNVIVDREYVKNTVSKDYKNRFRVAGAKLTIDGSPQGFTAWRDRPYYAPVGDYPPGYVGYPSVQPKDTVDAIDWAFANGIQLYVHSNGEAASDSLIAGVEAATLKHGRNPDRRLTLIHGQFLREDQVDSLKRLDVFCSLFPMHTFYWGDWHRDHTVGPALVDNISPTGWLVKRGMRFSSHTDAPVAFPDSMRVLDATVTRRSRSGDIISPDQRVDVVTALKAMTLWPAWQHFEEDSKGSIEVGKLADFVILTEDPTAVDPETLDQIKVAETVKEGETIYAATPEQLRKAGLLDPGGNGDSPFSSFLRAAAADREFRLLPEKRQTPRNRAMLARAMHNSACLGPVMAELTGAIVAGSRDVH